MEEELLDSTFAVEKDFKKIKFPVSFEFKISTLSNDFIAKDADGQMLGYVRQKMFKLKEDIQIFTNESKQDVLYTIKADKWIDFNTNYAFYDKNLEQMGSVGRKGMKSLWKANYLIHNVSKEQVYSIGEENPWAKVMDSLMGEIPIVGMFTGYMFNPKYAVKNTSDEIILRMKKEASFFGRKFTLEKIGEFPEQDAEEIMLSLMMMVLLERRRG